LIYSIGGMAPARREKMKKKKETIGVRLALLLQKVRC